MKRFWEIDALRGLAVVAMVLYHLSYDLWMFGVLEVSFTSGAGLWAGRTIGTTFIFLTGLSLTLSHARSPGGWGKYLRRGAGIFGYGMLITLVTLVVLPETPIIFGVLHLIGASIILAYPFLNFRLLNVALGLAVLLAGLGLYGSFAASVWLAPFGVAPPFFMPDYWPLLPYFGVVLLGIAAGNRLFASASPRRATRPAPAAPLAFLALLGRNSLPIYLIHQPILVAALLLLGVGSLDAL